jgi:tetratricopeptide (TPR) repeat protein/tRNA A-37 threonylcarbamoyl transferase component Bud32
MTSGKESSVAGDRSQSSQESELGRILEAYLADREAGRPVDVERLVAEHPALTKELRDCLAVMHLADRVADPSGSRAADGLDMAARGWGTEDSGHEQGVLSTLNFGPDAPFSVRLRDVPDERQPVVKPRSDAIPALSQGGFGRYQLQGEIARGGMGAILKGRDVDLGRDLAIKVMLESHRDNPDIVHRFVEEAQIGGQLQHPGIVPVFELGTIADRRPYFAMKLVKGRTLSALLHERTDPRHGLPRFLSIFEQICQTMAYAHTRGVIHRDLKPSNVMVGSFGEVQVMDWGLAKVLPEGGVADESEARAKEETVIETVRSGSAGSGSDSQAGSVLGTPAYMAPEQARGEVDLLDERADVFGLGAILCEILTGQPPFGGLTRAEIRDRAARGDLVDALGRLGGCETDGELIELANDCLAAERERRPRSAVHVSQRVTAYVAGVQDKLRATELARVEAQTRAEESQKRAMLERSRRRRTVALAASVLVTAGVVGGGAAYLAQQQQRRAARLDLALREAEVLRDEAVRAQDGPAKWIAARDAAFATERLLPDARDLATRHRAIALIQQVTAAVRAADNDQKVLAKFVDIRSAQTEDLHGSESDAAYADAFRGAGIDLDVVSPNEAGALIKGRPASVRLAMAMALDDWASRRRLARPAPDQGWKRLVAASRIADPDSRRNELRDLWSQPDRKAQLEPLRRLAGEADPEIWPVQSLNLLAVALADASDLDAAVTLLRRTQGRHPGDLWTNYILGFLLGRATPPATDEAIRFYSVARALRPETAHALAHELASRGRGAEAVAAFRDLVRLRPDNGRHRGCYGLELLARGDRSGANEALNAAVASLRKKIRNNPADIPARNILGLCLHGLGNVAEAIVAFREAIRLKPDEFLPHINIAKSLKDVGKLDEAIIECRRAIQIRPDLSAAHVNLAGLLILVRKPDDAIASCREALRLNPDSAVAFSNLGVVLNSQRKFDEGIASYRQALRLNPECAFALNNLGAALASQGKFAEAIAAFREGLRRNPEDTECLTNLGAELLRQGKLDEAIKACHEALRLNPDRDRAHGVLGECLRRQGKLDQAIAEIHEALRLKPNVFGSHHNLALALHVQGKVDQAVDEYRHALRLNPDLAEAHHNLAAILADQKRFDEAIAEYRHALRIRPDSGVRYNLAVALYDMGRLDDAIAEFRLELVVSPDDAKVHYSLAKSLNEKQNHESAIAEYREALRLKPDYPEAHCNLGLLLVEQGLFTEGRAELHRGHELGTKSPSWNYPSDRWVRDANRLVELEKRLPAILSGHARPVDAAEMAAMAQMCQMKKLYGGSARLWDVAFKAQPALAEDRNAQNRYNAACAAALASTGQGKDDPPLDDETKVRWRKQSIDWLKADILAWGKVVETGPPQTKAILAQTLQHWKVDTDLSGIRDESALKQLPDHEQKACRALWADVVALSKKSEL